MRDAGQRRFRILTEGRQNDLFLPAFEHLNHAEFCGDFIHSQIARYHAPDDHFDWGFLDVRQIETLLIEAMGDESFKASKTAVIAGRLSHMPRADAEHALIDVGIDTQSSISHNIDYLILGSKGTGGTKYDKAQLLNEAGKEITILDEQGFDNLLRSPKRPPEIWSALQKDRSEDPVRLGVWPGPLLPLFPLPSRRRFPLTTPSLFLCLHTICPVFTPHAAIQTRPHIDTVPSRTCSAGSRYTPDQTPQKTLSARQNI